MLISLASGTQGTLIKLNCTHLFPGVGELSTVCFRLELLWDGLKKTLHDSGGHFSVVVVCFVFCFFVFFWGGGGSQPDQSSPFSGAKFLFVFGVVCEVVGFVFFDSRPASGTFVCKPYGLVSLVRQLFGAL